MTLYLRDDKGDNILDIDICVKTNGDSSYVELISLVHIPIYSNLLLNNLNKKNKIIHDFDNLSNLRGWLWERYFMIGENDVNKFRCFQYESCRGLEGWIVICHWFDEFLQTKYNSFK